MIKWSACHKSLSLVLSIALLVCANSQVSSTELGGGSISASASGSISSSPGKPGGLSGSATAGASLGSGPDGASAHSSGSLGGSGSLSGSASAHLGGPGPAGGSIISGSENSGGATGSAGGSASLGSVASPGSAQSYALSTPKPEGLFSKMKDIVKSGVNNLVKDEGSEQHKGHEHSQASATASLTAGASLGSGETASNQKSEGLMDKLGEGLAKGREVVNNAAKEVKDDVKSILKPLESSSSSSSSVSSSSASGTVKLGGIEAHAKVSSTGPSHGPLTKLMNRGQDMVHRIENKAASVLKPPGSSDGMEVKGSASYKLDHGGSLGPSGSASASLHLGGPARPHEKGLAVEMLDKAHEVVRAPVEQALKPIDRALGLRKDPLVKAMEQSEELLRQPLSVVAKPVESVLSGAFKTTEESKAELSAQEQRELKLREEQARKEGRSVLGQITDKTLELAEKPWEIVLKPVDKALGLKKNPLLQLIDEIYELSKKPLDAVARPIESILRKMATGDQDYEVSVRFTERQRDSDPKLFTRLADGALNIADRVVTKPIELAMRPLGYDPKTRKNPVVEAAHSLKNATKVGLELLAGPIDRIIREIAAVGAIKDDAEREAEIERKRQEASRIVIALDRFHEMVQQPFEIVLKPVGQLMGYSKEGKKEPLLRAWDVGYQFVRAPLQVVSKPIEDAILGERKGGVSVKGEVKVGKHGVRAQASIKGGANRGGNPASAASARNSQSDKRKNYFVESIKRMEKFAARPIDMITSPIRRLILGEDNKPRKGGKLQAQAKLGPLKVGAKVQVNGGSANPDQPDKIVQTIEKINNVVLRPIEFMTQPLADMVAPMDEKTRPKLDIKAQGSVQMTKSHDKLHVPSKFANGASNSQASYSGPPKASSMIGGFGSGTPSAPMALPSSASISSSVSGGFGSGSGSSLSASAQVKKN